MSWKSFTKSVSKATKSVTKAVTDTTNKVVNTVVDTTNTVIKTITNTTDDAGDWIEKNVVKPINNQVIKPTEKQVVAVSNDVKNELVKVGYQIDNNMEDALKQAENIALQGTQAIVDSAVAIGDFIEENACNIFVGAAIAGAFAGLNANPQKQSQNLIVVGATGAFMATAGAAETIALKTASSALAVVFTEILWTTVPEFKRAFKGDKDTAEDTMAFIVFFFASSMPKTIIASGGTVIDGLIAWILTSLICTGNLPKQILDAAAAAK